MTQSVDQDERRDLHIEAAVSMCRNPARTVRSEPRDQSSLSGRVRAGQRLAANGLLRAVGAL